LRQKLTFFFKNIVFEKSRQFLNRIDEPQRAEWIKLLVNDGELKIRFGF